MKLFGTDPVQRRVIRFVIQMKSYSMNVKADGNRKRALPFVVPATFCVFISSPPLSCLPRQFLRR